jgi:hypothetical protein
VIRLALLLLVVLLSGCALEQIGHRQGTLLRVEHTFEAGQSQPVLEIRRFDQRWVLDCRHKQEIRPSTRSFYQPVFVAQDHDGGQEVMEDVMLGLFPIFAIPMTLSLLSIPNAQDLYGLDPEKDWPTVYAGRAYDDWKPMPEHNILLFWLPGYTPHSTLYFEYIDPDAAPLERVQAAEPYAFFAPASESSVRWRFTTRQGVQEEQSGRTDALGQLPLTAPAGATRLEAWFQGQHAVRELH